MNSTPEADEDRQFSISHLLAIVTCAAIVLAVGRMLPPRVFAGLCGGVAFIYLVLLSVLKVRSLTWHIGWWLLLAAYLGAAAWALNEA